MQTETLLTIQSPWLRQFQPAQSHQACPGSKAHPKERGVLLQEHLSTVERMARDHQIRKDELLSNCSLHSSFPPFDSVPITHSCETQCLCDNLLSHLKAVCLLQRRLLLPMEVPLEISVH